jgi:hypothetical protein
VFSPDGVPTVCRFNADRIFHGAGFSRLQAIRKDFTDLASVIPP